MARSVATGLTLLASLLLRPAAGMELPELGGVHAVLHFPEHPGFSLPVGERIDALVGVRSEAAHPVNVSLLMGGVHHPESYAFQLQNLTTQPFGGLSLGPGEALTLPYAFTLAPQLGGGPNPRYTLSVVVVTADAWGAFYSNTAFNRTVEVTEPPGSVWDVAAVVSTLVVLALGAGLLFYLLAPPSALSSVSGGGAKAQAASKVAAKATGGAKKASAPDMSEWLVGTSADPSGKKADKKSKKSK